ncbi:MAG TPA: cupin domain-containing protein [Polyangiales bacterium]|nr:cupin domain-containing protein [Polyangiales bacterium]
MAQELPPTRRIVTANDAQRRSFIEQDGPSPAELTLASRPGYRNSNLWRTFGPQAGVGGPDSVLEHSGVLPPRGGTILRVIDIPPESKNPEERRRVTAATFKQMFPDAEHKPDLRHPGMHVTQTIDYAILLQGELYAVLDETETLMKPGDILIQRGTNHAWSNRSDQIARIVFVLVDAQP